MLNVFFQITVEHPLQSCNKDWLVRAIAAGSSVEIIWTINRQEEVIDRRYGLKAPSIPSPSINTPFVTNVKGTATLFQPPINMHVGYGIETPRGTDFNLDFSL